MCRSCHRARCRVDDEVLIGGKVGEVHAAMGAKREWWCVVLTGEYGDVYVANEGEDQIH